MDWISAGNSLCVGLLCQLCIENAGRGGTWHCALQCPHTAFPGLSHGLPNSVLHVLTPISPPDPHPCCSCPVLGLINLMSMLPSGPWHFFECLAPRLQPMSHHPLGHLPGEQHPAATTLPWAALSHALMLLTLFQSFQHLQLFIFLFLDFSL